MSTIANRAPRTVAAPVRDDPPDFLGLHADGDARSRELVAWLRSAIQHGGVVVVLTADGSQTFLLGGMDDPSGVRGLGHG